MMIWDSDLLLWRISFTVHTLLTQSLTWGHFADPIQSSSILKNLVLNRTRKLYVSLIILMPALNRGKIWIVKCSLIII